MFNIPESNNVLDCTHYFQFIGTPLILKNKVVINYNLGFLVHKGLIHRIHNQITDKKPNILTRILVINPHKIKNIVA